MDELKVSTPTFTMGIEEEFFLVDLETYDLKVSPPQEIIKECAEIYGDQVSNEYLKCQIEIGTSILKNSKDAYSELINLRKTIAKIANKYGCGLIASSTHPFGDWQVQEHVDKERYNELSKSLAGTVNRLVTGGMHVHLGIENNELRIDLMNQFRYFLPHLLALSTSSPFWRGHDSGLNSYRLTVFDALPRTGLPDVFDSYNQYDYMVRNLLSSGAIDDPTKIWWDLRPSARYQTLESRLSDVCTNVKDTVAIASLARCIMSMLYRLRLRNQRWRIYPNILISENRWRAQRYGPYGKLIDFGKRELVSFAELLDEIIELTAEDAKAFDCQAEIAHTREIIKNGTSAEKQRKAYDNAKNNGANEQEAVKEVVKFLLEETIKE